MSKNYTQLSLEQRYQIEALLKAGLKQKSIAHQLKVHPSTISRELSRNIALAGKTSGEYLARNAQRRTNLRHYHKPKQVIFSETMKQYAIQRLTVDRWSPELISAIGRQTGECRVSHEWLYHWIWETKFSNKKAAKIHKGLYRFLRHGRRRRKRGNRRDNRGIIHNRVSIEKRPAIVKKRKRLGDIEVDLMVGKFHNGAVLVMTDRASLHTSLTKLNSKSSDEVKATIIAKLSQVPYQLHTLTFDNDQAFKEHIAMGKQLNVSTYFTRPYTSQDKGTVENRIGVLRRFIPKKTDLTFISEQQIKEVEQKLNNRPVRKFNYQTPNQVLQQKIALIT